MSDDLDSIYWDAYRVRTDPAHAPKMEIVPSADSPVKLTLALRNHASLERALANPARGAVLAVDMDMAQVEQLYLEILRFAQKGGYTLPRLDEPRAEFQRIVTAAPKPSPKKK